MNKTNSALRLNVDCTVPVR